MTSTPAPTEIRPTYAAHRRAAGHTVVEDVAGIGTGAFLASVGLFVLQAGGAVTGGTAGLALVLAQASALHFETLFLLSSLPFVAVALTRKGWPFTVRSALSVALVAGFSLLHPRALELGNVQPAYAALVGNLCLGLAILILFRHGSSLGGFNVVALVCQERLGWRAGYVQLALDATVLLAFSLVGRLEIALISAAGAVVLNLVLAMNHRPGRYVVTGASDSDG